MNKRLLITGANGFVGKHLVKRLVNEGFEVFTIGRVKVKHCNSFVIHNFNDYDKITNLVIHIKPAIIFHLASVINNNSIHESILINTLFPLILLEAVDKIKSQVSTKIILIGSAAEYGILKPNQVDVKETFLGVPKSYYGTSKLSCTNLAMNWFNEDKKLIIVRPFTIIGKFLPSYMAIGNFINQVKNSNNDDLEIKMGDLSTFRDFIDINDFIDIIIELLVCEKANGQIINICSRKPIQIQQIISYLIKHIPKNIRVSKDESFTKSNDMPIHFGNNQKLFSIIKEKKLKNWQVTMDEIIKDEILSDG